MEKFVSLFWMWDSERILSSWLTKINCWRQADHPTWNIRTSHGRRGSRAQIQTRKNSEETENNVRHFATTSGPKWSNKWLWERDRRTNKRIAFFLQLHTRTNTSPCLPFLLLAGDRACLSHRWASNFPVARCLHQRTRRRVSHSEITKLVAGEGKDEAFGRSCHLVTPL